MLSDTDPLLPSYSEPYQLALQCVPGQDSSQNTGFLFQSCELSHMEENASTELEAEKSQNHVEICYKASAADDKDRHTNDDIVMKLEEPVKAARPTSKEFTKTWRFRSTTIAQRAAGDVNRQDRGSARSRRGGRRCSGKAAEDPSAPKFVQGGKRNTTACLESSETPSQSPSDSESASEDSFNSIPGLSAMEESADTKQPLERTQPTSVPAGDATSSDQGDSDELTLKELQDLLRKRRSKTLARPDQDADPLPKEAEEKGLSLSAAVKSFERNSSGTPPEGTNQDSMSSYKTPRSSVGGKKVLDSEGEEKAMDEEESLDKSESKGHDSNALYCICQQKHNNRFMICCDHCEEWYHGDCVGITEVRGQLLERNGEDYVCPNCTMQTQPRAIGQSEETEQAACMTEGSLSTSQPGPSLGVEENDEDGQDIRGRIEKAVNPRRTKKIKIFRPVEESGALAKCIGPGCNKNALPDSVYCGTDCILKHAAATMKSLTSMKEPPLKTQAESKPATKSVPKGQKTRRRVMESCSRVGEEESSSEEGVVEPDSSSPFWSSDHCNDTAKPEKSTAIPSSVFYKSSGKESEGREGSEGHAHPQKQSPPAVKINMKNPNLRHPPPMNKPLPISRDVVTKKQNLPSRKSFISKKSIPVAAVTSQAACPPASKSVSGALRVSKINYTVPRMLSPQQQLSLALSSAACFASSSQPPRPQPNNQIRHDIRRSLTEILIKRVSDSDDLEMTEKEVGRLAVSIEKELYNLFLNTDKYKKKYRTIMFSLKDTKNKGLFFRIIRGEVTPFNLVRFSPEELLSQDVSGWMHKETTEVAVSSKTLPGPLRLGLKQEAPPMEKGESPLMSEGNACLSAASPLSCVASVPEQENRAPTSPLCKPSQHNVASPATDFFSMMLNDTTAEHRTHLFNLNCKICTGRVSTDDEPVSKKPKNALTTEQESHRSKAEDCEGDSPPPDSDFSIMESPASPDDTSNMATISEPIPIPAVPSVTITVRDPRIAGYRPIVTVPPVIPTVSSSAESFSTTKPTLPPPPPPPPPKSILLKPTSSPAMRFLSASGSSSSMADSRAPPGGETTLFLSKQEVVWKGFLNMHSVAKFVTKSYLVSGSLDNLKEDLPDTIHIGGRISPNTVWDYIDKLKTFLSKELCLIRFQPATDEEEVAYISLFSYFNSRGRFGVVANNSRNIKDLYLIPLGAKAPIPTQFLPFEGPGLEPNRPDLLLGLVICQKPKRFEALQSEDSEEKFSKILTRDSNDTGLPVPSAPPSPDINQDKDQLCNLGMPISTTPPGSPQSSTSSDSSSSLSTLLLPPLQHPVKSSSSLITNSGKNSPSIAASSATPLQTILKTLFGNKKVESGAALSSEHNLVEVKAPPAALLDPIVKQFGHISKEIMMEEDDSKRPYDPEEEYDPGMGYPMEEDDNRPYDPEEEYDPALDYTIKEDDNRPYDPEEEYDPGMGYKIKEDEDNRPYDPEEEYLRTYEIEEDDDRPYDPEEEYSHGMAQKFLASKSDKASCDDGAAYDPEDETIFEEVEGSIKDIPSQINGKVSPKLSAASESLTLIEQQKMLEELNKQIEEHKQQLAEQEEALRLQRAAVGVSLAHFSVSEALMSPPLKPLLVDSQFIELVKEDLLVKTSGISRKRDPRQSRDTQQSVANHRHTPDMIEKDCDIGVSVGDTTVLKPGHISQSPVVTKTEQALFRATGISEVEDFTPLLRKKMDHEIKNDFLQESILQSSVQNKMQCTGTSPAHKENNSISPKSLSILKVKELLTHESKYTKQSETLLVSKPAQKPYKSILKNSTRQESSSTGISLDITFSNIPKTDTDDELTVLSKEVQNPEFRGVEVKSLSFPLESLLGSSSVQGSHLLQGEIKQPQYRDGQFQTTGPSQLDDSPHSSPPSAVIVPRSSNLPRPMGKRRLPQGSLSLNNSGRRSPSPGQFMESHGSSSLSDEQNDSHRLNYNTFPPSFNSSGPRDPPHRHNDNRGPRPPHFPRLQGPLPHGQLGHRSRKPLLDTPRWTDEQQCNNGTYEQCMDQNKQHIPSNTYRGNQCSSHTHHRIHFEGQSVPGGKMEGQCFPPPKNFGAPRAPSPHFHSQGVPFSQHMGPFENQRGPRLSKLKGQRWPLPSQFRGTEDGTGNFSDSRGQPRSNCHDPHFTLDERPLHHSGPLLPTPLEGPIVPPHLMRNSSDLHTEKCWEHYSDMRSCIRENIDINNGNRTRMYEGGHHDEVNARGSSCLLEERQRELSEGHDISLGSLWDRNLHKPWSREREWDRSTGRGRTHSRGRGVDRHRERDGGNQRDRDQGQEVERDRDRNWKWRELDRERSRNKIDKNKDREYDRHYRERRHVRSRSRDYERDRYHGVQDE